MTTILKELIKDARRNVRKTYYNNGNNDKGRFIKQCIRIDIHYNHKDAKIIDYYTSKNFLNVIKENPSVHFNFIRSSYLNTKYHYSNGEVISMDVFDMNVDILDKKIKSYINLSTNEPKTNNKKVIPGLNRLIHPNFPTYHPFSNSNTYVI